MAVLRLASLATSGHICLPLSHLASLTFLAVVRHTGFTGPGLMNTPHSHATHSGGATPPPVAGWERPSLDWHGPPPIPWLCSRHLLVMWPSSPQPKRFMAAESNSTLYSWIQRRRCSCSPAAEHHGTGGGGRVSASPSSYDNYLIRDPFNLEILFSPDPDGLVVPLPLHSCPFNRLAPTDCPSLSALFFSFHDGTAHLLSSQERACQWGPSPGSPERENHQPTLAEATERT